jgi:hypothetical protein
MMGGGVDKAKKEFDIVFEITDGKFLLAKVLFAQYYATLLKEEELFKNTLNEVLNTPSDILPDATLANEVAKVKAKILLEKAGEYF